MTSARQNPRQLRSAHSVHHPCTILLSLFHPISISITNIATTTTTPFHHHLVSISPFALSCSRSFHPALLAVAADPRFCQAPYPRLLLAFILAPRPFIPNLAPIFITVSLLGLHVHNSLSLLSLRPALSFALISCHPPCARPLRPFILTSRDPSARIPAYRHQLRCLTAQSSAWIQTHPFPSHHLQLGHISEVISRELLLEREPSVALQSPPAYTSLLRLRSAIPLPFLSPASCSDAGQIRASTPLACWSSLILPLQLTGCCSRAQ